MQKQIIELGFNKKKWKQKRVRNEPRNDSYSKRFDDEVFVWTSSLGEESSDLGDELQRRFVHGGNERVHAICNEYGGV
jgi:hypothetical protein